jgi:hypothetical protein
VEQKKMPKPTDKPDEPLPALPAPADTSSEVARIGDRMNELARRISAGRKEVNDFSDLSDLIRKRATLLRPKARAD